MLPRLLWLRSQARYSSTSSLSLAENESKTLAVWFDNIYPIKLSRWDPRHLWARRYAVQLKEMAKKDIIPPVDHFKARFTYLNSVSSIKEGGLLVRFKYDGDSNEAFDTIRAHVAGKELRSLVTFGSLIKAHPVEGTPWIEDLRSSIPSSRVNVAFKGPELPIEQLYDAFRVYGKIDAITIQPGPTKDSPKYGHIQFLTSRSATNARVCLNGKIIGDTTIFVSYEPALSRNPFLSYIRDHPRISLPIILALLGFLSFLIFDPIRVFFVTNTITSRFSVSKFTSKLNESVRYAWKKIYLWKTLPKVSTNNGDGDEERENQDVVSEAVNERKVSEAKLMMYLRETPDTPMLVYGAKGTGSHDLVEKCVKNEPYILRINLDELINQSDYVMVNRLAKQFGCFPMFNWNESSSALLDTILTAATGAKSGLSSSTESQVLKIFEIATIAMNRLVTNQLDSRTRFYKPHDSQDDAIAPAPITNPSSKLTTAGVPEIQYPVIIIDGFLTNERAKQSFLYKATSDWVRQLTDLHIAQVVYISDNPVAAKYLGRMKTIESVTLGDASFASSLLYAQRRLGIPAGKEVPTVLKESVRMLGGRLYDLESLMQKIKAVLKTQRHHSYHFEGGEVSFVERIRGRDGKEKEFIGDVTCEQFEAAVDQAFHDLLVRAETDVRKIGLFENVGFGNDSGVGIGKEWTAVQMWKVVQLLTKYDEVSYDDLRFHPLFKGDESPIQAIERAGLISVGLQEGRPYTIKAGRPLHKSAFARLQSDKKYAAIMGLKTVKTLAADETAKLYAYETELSTLTAQISGDRMGMWSFGELRKRVDFLAKLVGESHAKLKIYDDEERRLKKVVKLAE